MGVNKVIKTLEDEIISIDKKNVEHLKLDDFVNDGSNKFLKSADIKGSETISVYVEQGTEQAGNVHIESLIPAAPTEPGVFVLRCVNGEYIWQKDRENIIGSFSCFSGGSTTPSATIDFDYGIYSRQGNQLKFAYYKDENAVTFRLLEYLEGTNPESFGNFRLFENDGQHNTLNASGNMIDGTTIKVTTFGTTETERTFRKDEE